MHTPDPDEEDHFALPVSRIDTAIILAVVGLCLIAGIGGLWKLIDILVIAIRDLPPVP